MVILEGNSFFANVAFRLVRKHIAGTTVAKALKNAMTINGMGMGATITFLNDHVDSLPKAKYNQSAYMQLLHQISRLNIRAEVSIRPSQLGYRIDENAAEKHMSEILSYAEKHNIVVWSEHENESGQLFDMHEKNLGIELPYSIAEKSGAKIGQKIKRIKVVPDIENGKEESEENEESKEKKEKAAKKVKISGYANCLDRIAGTGAFTTLLSHDYHFGIKAISRSKYRKDLILELPFGYSRERLAKIGRERINVNIYTPYGKDWIPYAVNRLTEGKRHKIAKLILEGRHPG